MEIVLFIFIFLILALSCHFIGNVVYKFHFTDKDDGLVDCDLCPQRIKPDGYHFENIDMKYGTGRFHNAHMFHQMKKQPIVGCKSFKERQKEKELQAELKKEREKQKQLEQEIRYIMEQPIGSDFVKELETKLENNELVEF
jgi:hypothetical protein